MRVIAVLAATLLIAACGGNNDSLTGPSARLPQVAGSYAGTVTIFYPELGRTLTCPATTQVNQTGAAIVFAPIILTGPCGTISLPLGDADIDANGSIGTETGTVNNPSCGVYQYTASGGFFGRQFQFSGSFNSSSCINFNITGTLSR